MNRKPKIIFDCDDILWDFNKLISEKTGIDYDKLVTFNVAKNPKLTEKEKNLLTKEYKNSNNFWQTKFYPGVERIKDLDANVFINSHVLSKEALDVKKHRLIKELKFPEDHLFLSLIDSADSQKEIPKDTYIFIDDACKNIAQSPARYNLMLRKPWNEDMSKLSEKCVEKYDTLNEIINRIIHILNNIEKRGIIPWEQQYMHTLK